MAAVQLSVYQHQEIRSGSTSPLIPHNPESFSAAGESRGGGSSTHTSPIISLSSKSLVMAATTSVSPANSLGENMLSPHPHRTSNYHGITALMVACQQGQINDVQKIVRQRKQSVKERSRSGKIPLHFCAEAGSVQCLDLVLSMEPFLINTQDEEGYTPIHLAVINGNKDAVKRLVTTGADLNCLDNEKHSLVHWATVCGEIEILDLLLANGAPASTPDIHLAHPIHYAAQMCGTANGVSGGSRARVQSTVYGVSPKKGLVILRKLIHHGCAVDVRDKDGRQPLLWAASAAGVHFYRRKYEAEKLVHVPFRFKGSSDGILSLVNAGARIDAEDKDGLTALHCAASRGHTDCVETLIALCGAQVDIIDNNGCTALFYAVTLGNADCTELLLNYGAEPNRQDRKGRTPAHCGASKGQLETLKLLAKHGANLWLRNVRGDLPLHEAVLSRRKDLVLWLLAQRPDAVNASNNDGRCPIHLAALNNNVEMVKILIDHSADVNMLMRSGKGAPITPLEAAMHKGNSAVAKFLQLHGGLPSNTLNDTSLQQRRLNRSIDSHHSPGSSMQSQMGSHHDPSPEDTHRAFISPEAFDSSIVQYSQMVVNKQGGTQHAGPFLATSTPIMDDSVQTDPSPSVRDMHVQVSDGLEEDSGSSRRGKNREKDDSSSTSHRKSERRRRRKSLRESSRSSSPDPDRGGNQKASRASKKSSRRSSKPSDSMSQSSARQSEEKELGKPSEVKNGSRSPSREKNEESPIGSPTKDEHHPKAHESDAILDTTLVDEKFSELENVAVLSSETDAREEDLASGDGEGKDKNARRKRSKSKTPVRELVEESSKSEIVESKDDVKETKEPDSRPESRKESILKSRSNSAKRTSVSWQDEAEQKSTHEIGRKSEGKDCEGKTDSVEEENEETKSERKDRNVKGSSSEDKTEETDDNSFEGGDRDEEDLDEIEQGKLINLQEAARRRSLSKPSSRERSVDLSDSSTRSAHKHCFDKQQSTAKKPGKTNNYARSNSKASKASPAHGRKLPTTSEEREIFLQEQILAGKRNKEYSLAAPGRATGSGSDRRSSREDAGDLRDSGFSEEHLQQHQARKMEKVNQLMLQQQAELERLIADGDGDESTSTRGDSVTSDDFGELGDERRRRKVGPKGPGLGDSHLSPRVVRKSTDVETPISVTQAMQASMRKYNLERSIFQQLLELKRLQIRAGKANEQVLVKRLADGYKKAGLAINFREYYGPYTFKHFEKYLYDQLRLLQANRKLVPRFGPSDDLEKLSSALKKMNATKLPYLEDETRAPSCCDNNQCTHSTHRCHHAAHAYTGVPCAAYIGKGRKPTFLPKVNPLRAPGPTQTDPLTRSSVTKELDLSKTASPMAISVSPRHDTQSPITLEVQQGQSTQVFTLPTQTLDPTKNYYVSLSIKPTNNASTGHATNGATTTSTANKLNFHNNHHPNNGSTPRNNPTEFVDDGSISAPPPPADNDPDMTLVVDRDKHNQSM